jgi:membrane fusion protein (multidrug efflux system)
MPEAFTGESGLRLGIQLVVIAVLGLVGYLVWQARADLPIIGPYFAESGGGQRFGGGEVLVDVAPVTSERLVDTIQAVGTTRANEAVTITSKVAGRVADIRFREGDTVRAGAVLLRLDAVEILAERDEAVARQTRARQNYERGVKLREARAVTAVRTEELAQELAEAEAAVAQIEARLRNYELKAPFSGRLGLRKVSQGALVTPGDEIVTLDDISVVKLDFDVPETALSSVHPGLLVSARSAAYPDVVLEGVVSTINTRIDPATRAVTVRAELANREGLLRPGMFLTVDLAYGAKEGALLVPEEAIVAVDDGMFVFAVVDGKAERRPVELGRRRPGQAEIVSGLSKGEIVVVGGVQKVRPGAPVSIRNNSADAGQKPSA